MLGKDPLEYKLLPSAIWVMKFYRGEEEGIRIVN